MEEAQAAASRRISMTARRQSIDKSFRRSGRRISTRPTGLSKWSTSSVLEQDHIRAACGMSIATVINSHHASHIRAFPAAPRVKRGWPGTQYVICRGRRSVAQNMNLPGGGISRPRPSKWMAFAIPSNLRRSIIRPIIKRSWQSPDE